MCIRDREYPYEYKGLIRASKAQVWHVLTRSELWQSWIENARLGHLFTSLSSTFGPGSTVLHCQEGQYDNSKNKAIVVDGRDGEFLRLYYTKFNGESHFIDVRFKQVTRTECEVEIIIRYFHTDNSGGFGKVVSFFMGRDHRRPKEPEGHRAGYMSDVHRAFRNFENLCEEYARHGEFYWQNDIGVPMYLDINSEGGNLVLFPDAQGKTELTVRSVVEADEVLGYLYDKKKHASHDEARRRTALSSRMRCEVLDVLKRNGDLVRPYDRIALVRYQSSN